LKGVKRPAAGPEGHKSQKATCNRDVLVELDEFVSVREVRVKKKGSQDAEARKGQGG